MKYIFSLLLLLIIAVSNAKSQKIGNVWYFGNRCGITFNTPDGKPRVITDNILEIWEGCATVSNDNGKIDFYTDGMNVISNNNDWMYINYTYRKYTLNGCSSSSQSSIIVPYPGDSLKYYIFTTECYEHKLRSSGINYSVVDMAANKGHGNIYPYNVNVSSSSLEKITATKHANGKDYWVISHAYDSDVFFAFLVDTGGVHSPVISHVSPAIGDYENRGDQGYLKVSSDGSILAAAYTQYKNIYLYNFNNRTGFVSNPRPLYQRGQGKVFYGLEFSPDGTKLYASFFEFDKGIYQYDLTNDNINAIRNSQTLILDEQGFPPAAMQLGPDGKIYVAQDVSPYLHVINHPNEKYPACNFQHQAIFLDVDSYGRKCHLGLPNAMTSIYFIHVKALAPEYACEGETVVLFADVDASSEGYSVKWSGPNGFTSTEKETEITNIRKNASGWYYVEVNLNGKTDRDSAYVQVVDSPTAEILPGSYVSICKGSSIQLTAMPDNMTYHWSTGETTQSITVNTPGEYIVIVENEFFCTDTASCVVAFYPDIKAEIQGNTTICNSDSTLLFLTELFETYQWSTGDTTPAIYAKQDGWVSVFVTDSNGCASADSIFIKFYDVDLDYSSLNPIDFGRVFIDSDSTISVYIKNNDNSDVTISDIYFTDAALLTHNNQLPAVIKAGESYEISITFSPYNIYDFRDSIFVDVASPCPMRLSGFIKGSGIVKLIAVLPDTTGEIAAKDFCIPVFAYLDTKRDISVESDYEMEVLVDAGIFLSYDIAAPVVYGKRKITLLGNSPVTRELSRISQFCGSLMLGDHDYSPLEFQSFNYSNPNVLVDTISGSLSVYGLCARNLSRVQKLSEAYLKVNPLPADDKISIEYKLIDGSFVTLSMADAAGEILKAVIPGQNVKKGIHKLTYDTGNLPAGVYYLILKNEKQVIIAKVLIVR